MCFGNEKKGKKQECIKERWLNRSLEEDRHASTSKGAVMATTPHKYLTVIFKLQNTETPASDKNTYSWNYQRNAKSWPSAPPSLFSL